MKDWEIKHIDDMSMGKEMGYSEKVVRLVYHVQVGIDNTAPLLSIAKEIVARAILETKVNAITVFFWTIAQRIGREVAYANIDWTPYGAWESADTVKSGDYTQHQFVVRWEGNEKVG